jgi:hypothetical protein
MQERLINKQTAMHFTDFIKSYADHDDIRVKEVVDIITNDADFPKNNSPAQMAICLYKKLNEGQTYAYQDLLLIYSQQPDNRLPKICFDDDGIAEEHAIRLINHLQNFDEG